MPATTTAGGSRHLPALDGLRGTAVLGVIAYHAGHLVGGYLGVDLFFVLSGFLITRLLLDEHGRAGTIDLRHFWARRARRLLPAVLLVLLAVALYSAFFATSSELATLRSDAISTLLYVANWNTILANHSYWAQFAAPSPLQHTWSLAIEEQFYVVWPLVCVVVLGRRRGRTVAPADPSGPVDDARRVTWLLWLSIAGAAVSAELMIRGYAPDVETTRLYVGTDTRAAAILLGAALACAHARAARTDRPAWRPPRVVLEAAGWLAVLLLAVAWSRLDGHDPRLYQGGLLACGVAVVVVIAAISRPDAGPLARVLSFAPLRFTGTISYGLYLWHWPIFTWLTQQRTGLGEAALLPLQLALTLGITLLSYELLELPIRRGALPPKLALALAPASVAVVLIAVVAATVPPTLEVSADPAAQPVTALAPLGGDAHQPARVLVVGDSVGDSVTRSTIPQADRFGVEIESLALPGCSLVRTNPQIHYLDGAPGDESHCLDRQAVWAAKIAEWDPDVVVVIFGWPGNTERLVDGGWRRPCDPTFDRWFGNELGAGLDALTSGGARVFLTTVPYSRSPRAPADSDQSTDCLNHLFTGPVVTGRGVQVLDLAGWVCPGGACRVEEQGITVRPDGVHFEGVSGLWAGDWVLHQAWAGLGVQVPAAPKDRLR